MLLKAAYIGGFLLAMALVACGGGDDVSSPEATEVSHAPTPAALQNLDSFHYVASLTVREKTLNRTPNEVTISTEGDFQQPDRHAFTYSTVIGDSMIERSAVIVGEEAWVRREGGAWRKVTLDDAELADLLSIAFSSVRPSFLGGEAYDQMIESVRGLTSTEVTVNGVEAFRYAVRSEGLDFLQSFFASEQITQGVSSPTWQLWLAKDGSWPVRLFASATVSSDSPVFAELGLRPPTAWEMQIDISLPDDPAVVVEPPEVGD